MGFLFFFWKTLCPEKSTQPNSRKSKHGKPSEILDLKVGCAKNAARAWFRCPENRPIRNFIGDVPGGRNAPTRLHFMVMPQLTEPGSQFQLLPLIPTFPNSPKKTAFFSP